MTQSIMTLDRSPDDSQQSPLSVLTFSGPLGNSSALDEVEVAELPSHIVSRLERDELVRVIETARLPLLTPDLRRRLQWLDRPQLERLAHLARRCCQNRRATPPTVPATEEIGWRG